MSLTEIKYYCTVGMNLYKQWKEAKKALKHAKEQAKEEKESAINMKSSKTKVSAKVDVDPDVIMANMKAWMEQLGDGIYNGFIVLQVLDTVKTIKEVVKQATDVSLESLATDINTVEDVIDMLEEIGLADDSTAIDLSMIPALGINNMMAGLDRLKNISTADMLQGAVNTISPAVNISTKVENVKTVEIKTDVESKTITVAYYSDPTKSSVSKKVYKAFSKAEDANKNKMFSLSEVKVIQDNINDLWTKYQSSDSSENEREVTVGKYKIVITMDIELKKDKS